VSDKIKTLIENNRVLWFHITMEQLGAIIKVLNARKYMNNKVKKWVKFKEGYVRLMNKGYIVKLTPAHVFVVLEGDLFRNGVEDRIVEMENKQVQHVRPFVGEVEEVVNNATMTCWGL
jgi:hypothetical protein